MASLDVQLQRTVDLLEQAVTQLAKSDDRSERRDDEIRRKLEAGLVDIAAIRGTARDVDEIIEGFGTQLAAHGVEDHRKFTALTADYARLCDSLNKEQREWFDRWLANFTKHFGAFTTHITETMSKTTVPSLTPNGEPTATLEVGTKRTTFSFSNKSLSAAAAFVRKWWWAVASAVVVGEHQLVSKWDAIVHWIRSAH